jgi:hypothetical protein
VSLITQVQQLEEASKVASGRLDALLQEHAVNLEKIKEQVIAL